MFKQTLLVVAALASHGLGQTLTVPTCAQTCLSEAQTIVDCDLTQLPCLCQELPGLFTNTTIFTCLSGSCAEEVLLNLIDEVQLACNPGQTSYTSPSSTATYVVTDTSEVVPTTPPGNYSTAIYPNATTTTATGTETSAGSEPTDTTSETTGANPTATTSPNVAARSEFGMLALGIAVIAALAL